MAAVVGAVATALALLVEVTMAAAATAAAPQVAAAQEIRRLESLKGTPECV